MTTLRDDFFWGNSTSSMQTEGATNEGSKGPSVYDVRPATENASDWSVAIDEYHRYPEDIALMKDLGMNFYRFQISWSRVQPMGEGAFNEAGIAFYDRLINDLLAAGIQPMICLYHFDMPLALAQKYNGFLNRHVVDAFYVYAQEMLKRFGDRVRYWITFNEQNLYSLTDAFVIAGYLEGPRSLHDLYQIQHNVALAHALVANTVHADYPELQIGGMVAYQQVYPATANPQDVAAVRRFKEYVMDNLVDIFTTGQYSPEVVSFMQRNHLADILKPAELDIISQTRSDFLSFSYYSSAVMDSTKIPLGTVPNYYPQVGVGHSPYLPTNEWQWQVDPQGFNTVLHDLYNRGRVPVFPIENGIGLREHWDGKHMIQDDARILYMREHIQALKDAVAEGVDVLGYLGWGLIDIPSSQGNMDKRYGVVYVNRGNHDLKDLKRVPKKSYAWLKEAIRSNGAVL